MLHVTNGESVVETLRAARLPGKYLSWIDVLHEGPVPNEPPQVLARTRALFLADAGATSFDDALRSLTQRDATLAWHESDDEIVLWFEHDLFDQLQLIQVLDRISSGEFGARLSLININSFHGIPQFIGLGQLTANQLASLFPSRTDITAEHLNLGSKAWHAFTHGDPTQVYQLAQEDTSALAFLRSALYRWFEEFPSIHNGLSRTEEQIVRAVANGALTRQEIYLKSREPEEAIFMGDTSVFWRLDRLSGGSSAPLSREGDSYRLTDTGRQLLNGKANWLELVETFDHWLGGTHLTVSNCWLWDSKQKVFAYRSKAGRT